MNRTGLSVLEVTVVAGILAVLIGLVLPAVHTIRETTRSLVCKNRLRQLGLATSVFESSHGRLPPGSLGFQPSLLMNQNSVDRWENDPDYRFYWKRTQHTSFLILLLPYLGHDSLFAPLPTAVTNIDKIFDDTFQGLPPVSWVGEYPAIQELAQRRVNDFMCPSDRLHEQVNQKNIIYLSSQPVYMVDRARDGILAKQALGFPFETYISNYFGCSGAYSGGDVPDVEIARYDGAFACRNGKRLGELLDGLSTTLLCGESIGQIDDGKRLGGFSWCFGGMIRGRGWLPWGSSFHPEREEVDLFGHSIYSHASSFGSFHPLSINTVFVDGSVQSVHKGIDIYTWYSLCGAGDGNVIDREAF